MGEDRWGMVCITTFVALLYTTLLAINATAHTQFACSQIQYEVPYRRALFVQIAPWLVAKYPVRRGQKKDLLLSISRWKINRKKGKENFILIRHFYRYMSLFWILLFLSFSIGRRNLPRLVTYIYSRYALKVLNDVSTFF